MTENIYTDGSYLEKSGGTWHLEDSAFKVGRILELLARNPGIAKQSICEIGCGAGGILEELQKTLGKDARCTGYDISPQAISMAKSRARNPHCQFVLGNAFDDKDQFDLVLVMDVVEHVEDCFSFVRNCGQKGRYKVFHIPLEASASSVMRGANAWDSLGHIHIFSIETALKTIEHSGLSVRDWLLTSGSIAKVNPGWKTRCMNQVRRIVQGLNTKLAARLMGGYSILILAE